ncbi:MFS transporter like protein [Zymoseptoria brevis]|uniref:MFS transporter like protein n=1 Tax=Zymoseptoria brevis TaxID=1047168 RepID=A0A0F4GH53_9PEZI|nr:MFS transporter like protein [Zymoseptoria brevis]
MAPPNDETRPLKPSLRQRQSSTTPHYQTFPTAPPRNAGRPPPPTKKDSKSQLHRPSNGTPSRSSSTSSRSSSTSSHDETPLPKGQLAILAVIALAEQTALNSISPYLPSMASTFPDIKESEIGLYVGLIASAFALAQFATNFLWGWLSDRIGRKPIVLTGTILTAACFMAFGFCRTLWQAILVQLMMGLVNGNQGVISTCLGEITDRSNQSRAFTYLPVIYGLGGITGPLVGGLLVFQDKPFQPGVPNPYPYLWPNVFAALVLVIDFVLTAIFLEESLGPEGELPPLKKRMKSLFSWIWQFSGDSQRPTYTRPTTPSKSRPGESNPLLSSASSTASEADSDVSSTNSTDLPHPETHTVLNRNTLLLLSTYLLFQLSNIAYNSLYPIFSGSSPPIGRSLSPEEIGTSLAFAGAITIVFQVGVFGYMRDRLGNKTTYRLGLAGFVVSFGLMPWVGYKDGKDGSGSPTTKGKIFLWAELGGVLIIKTVASVGGLTSALLLITNSAPSHAVLGTLNGLAQTLSAAGRALGPLMSGALFSAATRVKTKGEALAFGVFAGIAFVGLGMSFGIRGKGLEAEGWSEQGENGSQDGDEESADGR